MEAKKLTTEQKQKDGLIEILRNNQLKFRDATTRVDNLINSLVTATTDAQQARYDRDLAERRFTRFLEVGPCSDAFHEALKANTATTAYERHIHSDYCFLNN